MQIEISLTRSKRVCERMGSGERILGQELMELSEIRNELIHSEDRSLEIVGHKLKRQEEELGRRIRTLRVMREAMQQVENIYRKMERDIEESSEGYTVHISTAGRKSISRIVDQTLIDETFVR